MLCGIDWASERHAVCVLDDAGTKRASFHVDHTADGLDQLVAHLGRLGDPAALPVAVERPDGRLVDRLLEAGHPVVPVQPNAVKAWRDAEVVSGAKHDAGDARLLAEYLRLRRHRLRVLAPFSAATRALRAVVRTRDDLVDQRVTATNQLAASLDAFWPGARCVFADLASPIALDFLARYPTPESAASLGEARMRAFLVKHGYSGRRQPGELVARLRAAPPGLTGTVEVEARRDAVLALVRVLRALNHAVKDLDRSVAAHLGEHPGRADLRVAATLGSDQRRPGARRCDHPHAVRILARAWIRVIWRCWVDQVPYDPAKHGAARKLTETAASTT